MMPVLLNTSSVEVAGEDHAADIGLAVDLGERGGDDVGEMLAGDDEHAVDVADDHVARLDVGTVLEGDGAAEIGDLATQALVLGVGAGREDREAKATISRVSRW